MSHEATTPASDKQSFLAEDEEPEAQWRGVLIEHGMGDESDSEHPAEFILTNSRLILSIGQGHFKDLGLEHIESIESSMDVEMETEGFPPIAVIGMSAVSILVGIGFMVAGGFSGASLLFGLVTMAGGAYGIWWTQENREQLEKNHEVFEKEVYHILVQTDASSAFARPLHIKSEENVAPILSKKIQGI